MMQEKGSMEKEKQQEEEEQLKSWHCVVCTLENEPLAYYCDACNTQSPLKSLKDLQDHNRATTGTLPSSASLPSWPPRCSTWPSASTTRWSQWAASWSRPPPPHLTKNQVLLKFMWQIQSQWRKVRFLLILPSLPQPIAPPFTQSHSQHWSLFLLINRMIMRPITTLKISLTLSSWSPNRSWVSTPSSWSSSPPSSSFSSSPAALQVHKATVLQTTHVFRCQALHLLLRLSAPQPEPSSPSYKIPFSTQINPF